MSDQVAAPCYDTTQDGECHGWPHQTCRRPYQPRHGTNHDAPETLQPIREVPLSRAAKVVALAAYFGISKQEADAELEDMGE